MPLIGISGKAGAGKDLVGVIIQYLVHTTGIINMEYWEDFKNKSTFNQIVFSHYVIKKFADKLKDIVCLLIGYTREQLEDRVLKEQELGEEWWYYKGRNNSLIPYNQTSKRSTEDLIKPTPRLLLQLIGTDLFRKQLHPNTWVNASFANYLNNAWIFTDVRFPNEADSIKEIGGIIIRVNRFIQPNCKACDMIDVKKEDCNSCIYYKEVLDSSHESETALDDYEFDYVIENDSNVEELIKQVKKILIKEKIL